MADMSNRSVRRSQTIHPYGPGAIIDQGQESFVVLDSNTNYQAWNQPDQIIRLERTRTRAQMFGWFQITTF